MNRIASLIVFSIIIISISIMGWMILPKTVSAELISDVQENEAVKLSWPNTGSGPYKLYRESTGIYSGSSESFTDNDVEYGNTYSYRLEYQNYEKKQDGYWDVDWRWEIVEPEKTVTEEEWQVVVPAHREYYDEEVDWCYWEKGSDPVIIYQHEPPCTNSDNLTTKSVRKSRWVEDEYGYVNVEKTIPAVYDWVGYDEWEDAVYGYVTKNTSVSVHIPFPPTPPAFEEIISPQFNQVFGGNADSFVPHIKVIDVNGDPLATAYYIDNESSPRETRTVSNTTTVQSVHFSAMNIGNMSEGVHILRFTANDGEHESGDSVDIHVDKTPPGIVQNEILSTSSLVKISGTAEDVLAGLDSTPYRYTIGGDSSAWTAETSYTQTNLLPNRNYSVKFEAKDKVGHISVYEKDIFTKAQAPEVDIDDTTETTVDLSFSDGNPAVTPYLIRSGSLYVSAAGTLTSNPEWLTLNQKKVTVTGLDKNTEYHFQVKARNGESIETAYSTVVSGTTLPPFPSGMTADTEQQSITIQWEILDNIIDYEVEVDGKIIGNGVSTTYIHNGLSPNTRHTYRVRATNPGGTGQWSEPFEVYTLPDPPPVPGIVNIDPKQTELIITWDGVARAEAYDIEADSQVFEAGNVTSYTLENLQPETEYTVRIRSKNPGGMSGWSEAVTISTLPFPPEIPSNVKAELSIYSVSVSWDEMERAVAYEIEVDGLITENGLSTTYLHERLEPLSGHTYRVRAKNAGGKSGWSDPLNVTTHPEKPVTPSNVMVTSDEQEITLMWYKVPHAESYEVEVDGGDITAVSDTQFIHTGLSTGSNHSYRIRAENISGYSDWSPITRMSTLPSSNGSPTVSLTNIAAIVTNQFITLSWDTVAPDAEYELEVDGVLQDNGSQTIYHHGGLSANEFHTYKIRLKNGEGSWVAVLSLSTLPNPPDAPTELDAFAADYSIELRWEKIEGASGYDIEIDGNTMGLEEVSTYLHENLDSGTAHTYRIRAKNVTGVTAWSPSITTSTTSPVYTVDTVKDTPFELSLLANNVQDFSEMTFVVTYDSSTLDIEDLYAYSPENEVNVSGSIPGTRLMVDTTTAGRIEFTVNQNIIPGTSWSGEITTIILKPRTSGQTEIDVTLEQGE